MNNLISSILFCGLFFVSCSKQQEPIEFQVEHSGKEIAQLEVKYSDSIIEYIVEYEAKELFPNLLASWNPVIHIMRHTNLSEEWLEKSVDPTNWIVKEVFKQTRQNGTIDYDFTVHPKSNLLGFDVLIPNEEINLRDEMFDRDYYLFFDGDKPKSNISNKNIISLNIEGSFLPTEITGADQEMKNYLIKILGKKPLTAYERDKFLKKLGDIVEKNEIEE